MWSSPPWPSLRSVQCFSTINDDLSKYGNILSPMCYLRAVRKYKSIRKEMSNYTKISGDKWVYSPEITCQWRAPQWKSVQLLQINKQQMWKVFEICKPQCLLNTKHICFVINWILSRPENSCPFDAFVAKH